MKFKSVKQQRKMNKTGSLPFEKMNSIYKCLNRLNKEKRQKTQIPISEKKEAQSLLVSWLLKS